MQGYFGKLKNNFYLQSYRHFYSIEETPGEQDRADMNFYIEKSPNYSKIIKSSELLRVQNSIRI